MCIRDRYTDHSDAELTVLYANCYTLNDSNDKSVNNLVNVVHQRRNIKFWYPIILVKCYMFRGLILLTLRLIIIIIINNYYFKR